MILKASIHVVLMVSMFFGPLACCCTWSNLLPFSFAAPKTTKFTSKIESGEYKCPYCKKGNDKSKGVGSSSNSPVPSESCPCCEARNNPNLAIEQNTPDTKIEVWLVDSLPPSNAAQPVWNPQTAIFHADSFHDRQTFLIEFCHRMRC